MTLREFSGWVPAERHTHFDADGNETGFTVVERESRIDDADRTELLALALHDAQVCPGCGWHPVFADDPEALFTPETRMCHACAAQAEWNRVLSERDEKVPHDAPANKRRPSDGRHSHIRVMSKDEAASLKGAGPGALADKG